MSEQLYRWVKASERVPDIWTLSQSKRIPIRTHGEYYNTGIYRNVNGVEEFEIGNKETSFEKQSFHLIEWLEPLPLNADVEQAAKKQAKDYIDMEFKDQEHITTVEAKAVYVIGFIAGAGYGKGGEDLVKQLREANPYDVSKGARHRNLLRSGVWNECIDALQELLKQNQSK